MQETRGIGTLKKLVVVLEKEVTLQFVCVPVFLCMLTDLYVQRRTFKSGCRETESAVWNCM